MVSYCRNNSPHCRIGASEIQGDGMESWLRQALRVHPEHRSEYRTVAAAVGGNYL